MLFLNHIIERRKNRSAINYWKNRVLKGVFKLSWDGVVCYEFG